MWAKVLCIYSYIPCCSLLADPMFVKWVNHSLIALDVKRFPTHQCFIVCEQFLHLIRFCCFTFELKETYNLKIKKYFKVKLIYTPLQVARLFDGWKINPVSVGITKRLIIR